MVSKFFLLFSISISFVNLCYAGGDGNADIVFKFNETQKIISLSELNENLDQTTVALYDAMLEKQKRYKSFPLEKVLDFAFGQNYQSLGANALQFIATDGYKVVISLDNVKKGGAYLTFNDIDYPDWELIKNSNPGPFYLVWDKRHQVPEAGFPWPWQIANIVLINSSDYYLDVNPDLTANEQVKTGFDIFKVRCMSCHAMNKQGGVIGPDLGAPRTITSYRSDSFLKEYIKSPSAFRYSKMPDFADLSEQDVDKIIRYFKYYESRTIPDKNKKHDKASHVKEHKEGM